LDSISTSALVVGLVVLIFMSAYFSSSETAMMALNRYRLRHLAKTGHRGAQKALMLLKKPERLIGLILIGNNLVNIMASSLATIIGLRLFGDIGIAISTGVLTIAVLIFAEVTPKTLAALYPEKLAFISSHILHVLMVIFSPLVGVINFFSSGLLRLFGVSTQAKDEQLSRDEIRSIVAESKNILPNKNKEMLLSVLELDSVTVDDIMVPRSELYSMDLDEAMSTLIRVISRSPYSRIVVYQGNADNLVGLLHLEDLVTLMAKQQLSKAALQKMVRKPYFVPENTALHKQLYQFQSRKFRTGFVVDEYGDVLGLLTLEDILEEIVGDISLISTGEANEIIPQQDGSVVIDGGIYLRDLNKEMAWTMPVDGPKTLNGLILEYLEDMPRPQTSLRVHGYPMEIVDVSGNMIKQVRVLPELIEQHRIVA
jgi:Mg2+/Co2+ transporter CorB